ncbi:helix-turn-helix domain-containing protein [Streptomyces sp. NPDC059215]|uniref:helix-turn-helix domain-containing protein n=1 Tax=Streptomyces sp. NPDC059215 TaxID=3346772 RepID=UPI0036CF1CA4
MQNLSRRLAAVDESVGAALDVIAYFDQLAQSRAGLEAVVRGAAVLSGVPAGLVDPDHRILIRVEPDGTRRDVDQLADPRWRSIAMHAMQTAVLWLETERRDVLTDDMVMERAAMVTGLIITRVRGIAPPAGEHDYALIETLVDPNAAPDVRASAGRRLGLAEDALCRAVASPNGVMTILLAEAEITSSEQHGVGPAVGLLDLPASAAKARSALRFTATGTPQDPGPRVVYSDEVGALIHLAGAVDARTKPSDDLAALLRASAELPWLLNTLTAFSVHSSTRGAATELFLHHSTVQERINHAERLLGWPLRTPSGRWRLHLALAERLLLR